MNIIEIKNLYFSYTKRYMAVNDVSLDIKRGEFVCILGHNGSGKSTLAKLLMGLLQSTKGTITVDGDILNEVSINKIRKKMGIVFQNPDNQFVGITVRDDIAFGMENRRVPKIQMEDAIERCSRIVGMNKFLDRNPEDLSGGEKQRVAIAGVLTCDPDIIILDEATSMLDPKGFQEVNEVIKDLKGVKTIISITHNLSEAIYADRVIVMNNGKIILNDTPMEAFKQSELLRASKLDILDTMKLIELVKNDDKIKNKEQIEEILWALTFKK